MKTYKVKLVNKMKLHSNYT